MKDDPIKICPECKCEVKRLLYPVGIVFKGSGWYINDSRKPDTSDSPETPTASAEKADKAGAAGGSVKPVAESKGETAIESKKSSGDSAQSAKTPAPSST